jgi:hypothetical protein
MRSRHDPARTRAILRIRLIAEQGGGSGPEFLARASREEGAAR